MNEVEKMYKNAGIEKDCVVIHECLSTHSKCEHCNKTYYPPFTVEKQLELIKLLQRKNGYKFIPSSTNDNSEYLFFAHKDNTSVQDLIVAGDKCYEEALASFINNLWQSLTEEERKQIKEILK